jgi:hypothetical protein
MEKLEDIEDEIIDINCKEIIEENEDIIIKNTLNKINNSKTNDLLINELSECYKSKKKLERLEDRLIQKIYEKFSIIDKIDEKEPIDFIYTYEETKSTDNKHLTFFLNLQITRNYLPFLRNIIIITPTPNRILEYYSNDKQIFILHMDNIDKYKSMTTSFHPEYLIYFLKDLKYVSNLFFYSNSDCIIAKPIKKSDLLKLKINMMRKTLHEEKNLKEYNANKEFEKKFGVYNQLVAINQVNLIRKDVIIMMSRLFGLVNYPIDYLSLQYLIGYYFKIYDIELKEHNASGFYQYTLQFPYERFNSQIQYFCFNYVNKKIIPYYVKWGLIHLGIIRDIPISTIYLVGEKIKYYLPILEKMIGSLVKLVFIGKINKQKGKIGENIFLIDSSEKYIEKIEIDTIMLKINGENIEKLIPDILYFSNIYIPHKKEYDCDKYKEKNLLFEVIYPRIIIKNREFLIQLLGYGDSNDEIFGTVKRGFIEFINKK